MVIKNLCIKNLNMELNNKAILSNINMEIKDGEFICIVGPSGCGKTTLLNTIGGFLKPTTGRVFYNNFEVKKPTSNISIIFQQHVLFPWMNVYENIESGLKFLKTENNKRVKIVTKLLNDFNLENYANFYPNEISHGMRQKVAICRSLAVNPSIILMDEPFSSVDAITRLNLQKYLLNIWSRFNKTIIFVTHDINEAIFLSDRIFVLTKKSAKIKKEIINPLIRPRSNDIILSDSFLQIKKELIALIKDEI